jgi:hypothetical protein
MTTRNAYKFEHRKLTQQELNDEARARFGDDPARWAFECPNCGDVATVQDFADAGDADAVGQQCIGRLLGTLKVPAGAVRSGKYAPVRGCDWAAFGLFAGPWEIVMPDRDGKPGGSAWSFPLAPAPEGAAA